MRAKRPTAVIPPIETWVKDEPIPFTPTNPAHYRMHPSGVECITITEWFGFNIGNAIKYLWRAGLKSEDPTPDLEKAVWCIQREIQRRVPKD